MWYTSLIINYKAIIIIDCQNWASPYFTDQRFRVGNSTVSLWQETLNNYHSYILLLESHACMQILHDYNYYYDQEYAMCHAVYFILNMNLTYHCLNGPWFLDPNCLDGLKDIHDTFTLACLDAVQESTEHCTSTCCVTERMMARLHIGMNDHARANLIDELYYYTESA